MDLVHAGARYHGEAPFFYTRLVLGVPANHVRQTMSGKPCQVSYLRQTISGKPGPVIRA